MPGRRSRAAVAPRPATFGPALLILLAVLGVVGLLSLLRGFPRLDMGELLTVLNGGGARLQRLAVLDLRLPRFVLAGLAGAALGAAGVLLQDTLRNALAGPELLGISSGAVTVVAALTVFRIPLPLALYPWLALAGGLVAGAVVLAVLSAARTRSSSALIVVVGAAMAALLGAVVTAIISLGSPNDLHLIVSFLQGSVAGTTWPDVRIVVPWLVPGLLLAGLTARPLNLLRLGDDVAAGLGLRVVRARLLLLALAAALVAAVVSVCGAISFVALLVPHLARRLLRTGDTRLVLPLAALMGSVLLTSADLLARELLAPRELPVGLWTTLVGGPVLLALLRRELGGGPL